MHYQARKSGPNELLQRHTGHFTEALCKAHNNHNYYHNDYDNNDHNYDYHYFHNYNHNDNK